MTTCSTIEACLPLPLSAIYATTGLLWSAAKSHQRHTCGYIIVIDLLGLCLGPRVVDGLVEGVRCAAPSESQELCH
jgi:hypothetical protein